MEYKEKVRGYLSKFLNEEDLSDDEDIFQLGQINSLFAFQLIMFIEKEFSIMVDNSDLDIDNFKSINGITDFIESKLA
ncbi:acyl carrier protein [Alkaliphilus transvaalensis]|uniref:acyl carrier protein n=1 Tax=Alkaliphilus transvaalensis TaxID=114628 RepID=UPI00047AE9D6|nr:acyl carrier protein [Alkaliphilus transvaalensis]